MKKDMLQFVGQNYINLETFRLDGKAVQTPVWFVTDSQSDTFYVRTAGTSGKVRRIHKNSMVNIMPCGQSGEPLGTWVPARAREAIDTETAIFVRKLLLEKYGEMVLMFEARAEANGQKYTVLVIDKIGEQDGELKSI